MPVRRCVLTRTAITAVACVWLAASAVAQTAPAEPQLSALAAQVQELRATLQAIQQDLATSRRESETLRQELAALRGQLHLPSPGIVAADADGAGQEGRDDVPGGIAEEQGLLAAKVDDLEQSKVESGSRYHVRLSGLALLNVVGTSGAVDSLDLPMQAIPKADGDSAGAVAAGMRQSSVSLALFGPTLRGARTSADLAFDFFGGLPATADGLSSGFARLRTAKFAFDWKNTSVVAGQEPPFFSPLSPTSLASSAYPALSGAGNVWAWTPQLFIEHRVSLPRASQVVLQAGVLDPLTGELPASEYNRLPTAGERSRRPAEAVRLAWRRTADRPASVGVGAYHARQDWGFIRTVDAWMATTDIDVPLGPWLSWSGELYRGRAIGGLGGGLSSSVLFRGPSELATSPVLAIESAGGWSQIKVKPVSRFEINLAAGKDSPFRTGVARLLATPRPAGAVVSRNASGFVNAIYQARSNILFSLEYRRLWTATVGESAHSADHVSVSSGFAF